MRSQLTRHYLHIQALVAAVLVDICVYFVKLTVLQHQMDPIYFRISVMIYAFFPKKTFMDIPSSNAYTYTVQVPSSITNIMSAPPPVVWRRRKDKALIRGGRYRFFKMLAVVTF